MNWRELLKKSKNSQPTQEDDLAQKFEQMQEPKQLPEQPKVAVKRSGLPYSMDKKARNFAGKATGADVSSEYRNSWMAVFSTPKMVKDVTFHRVHLCTFDMNLKPQKFAETLEMFYPKGEGFPELLINVVYAGKEHQHPFLTIDIEYQESDVDLEFTKGWVRDIMYEQSGNDDIPVLVQEWTDLYPFVDTCTTWVIELGNVCASDDQEYVFIIPSADILEDVYDNSIKNTLESLKEYLAPEGYNDFTILSNNPLTTLGIVVVNVKKLDGDEGETRSVSKLMTTIQTIIKANFYRWKKKEDVSEVSESFDASDEIAQDQQTLEFMQI